MLWFALHNIIKQFTDLTVETRNLTTFMVGVVIYTLMYTFLGSITRENNAFLFTFFNFFGYIILADAFSMAIIYKNHFHKPIVSEFNEVFAKEPDINIPIKTETET